MGHWERGGWFLGALAVIALLTGGARAETAPVRMTLVTTPKYTDEMRVVNGALAPERPGHHVELMREAAGRCGASVEFRFAPWQRALLQVKNGDADGAFSSSYDEERATYGVYPMADGKPDTARALKGYSYSLYAHRESGLAWGEPAVGGGDRTVAVERGASVIPRIAELGFLHVEIADNATMLRMVAGRRVAAAAVMTSVADTLLADHGDLGAAIVKLEPPVEAKFGYVMLSKPFHARHRDVAECFWTMIRDIRTSPRHAELVRSYLAENLPSAAKD